MYSSHGHHIPGTTVAGLQPLRVRCGGFERCEQCLREAAKVLVKSEKDHHHILIGLSLKTVGRDQKIRGLLTNTIAWTFFGDEEKTIVDVTPEQVAQAKIAAERCMVALREFNKLSQEDENHEPSVSGGDGRESTSDEHESEVASESQIEDATEASKEGLHGI